MVKEKILVAIGDNSKLLEACSLLENSLSAEFDAANSVENFLKLANYDDYDGYILDIALKDQLGEFGLDLPPEAVSVLDTQIPLQDQIGDVKRLLTTDSGGDCGHITFN